MLINARITEENKRIYKKDGEIQDKIKEIEDELGEGGRILVRSSGTEPLVRVMLEGQDVSRLHELAQALADLITRKFS